MYTDADHAQKAVELVIGQSLSISNIYDGVKVMDVVNKRFENITDGTIETALGAVMQALTYSYNSTITSIRVLSLHILDYITLTKSKEKTAMEKNKEFNLENFANVNSDMITLLYSSTTLSDSINTLIDMEHATKDELIKVKEKYNDDILEYLNYLINPFVDFIIKDEILDEWQKDKVEMSNDGILFVMFQHSVLIELLCDSIKKYGAITLTKEQLSDMYYNTLKEKLKYDIADEVLKS